MRAEGSSVIAGEGGASGEDFCLQSLKNSHGGPWMDWPFICLCFPPPAPLPCVPSTSNRPCQGGEKDTDT